MIPERAGMYSVEDDFCTEIEVYLHPVKGLCVWTEDYGAIPDEYEGADGHVPVASSGLSFLGLLKPAGEG